MKNSILIKYTRCPRCADRGKDKKGSNLGVYSDGHSFCYACKLYIKGDRLYALKNPIVEKVKHEVTLPSDVDVCYPREAIEWIEQYELDRNDLLLNNVLWSESYNRLIFPIYDGDRLIAWIGRYFGKENKSKWFSKGDMQSIYHVLGEGDSLTLVEDVVSAIKLSKTTATMPIFGCVIGLGRWNRLKLLDYNIYNIWLDPDKRKQSMIESRLANSLGLNTNVIFSENDPKEITYEDIANMDL